MIFRKEKCVVSTVSNAANQMERAKKRRIFWHRRWWSTRVRFLEYILLSWADFLFSQKIDFCFFYSSFENGQTSSRHFQLWNRSISFFFIFPLRNSSMQKKNREEVCHWMEMSQPITVYLSKLCCRQTIHQFRNRGIICRRRCRFPFFAIINRKPNE